jgi:hypothetical protein
VRPDELRCSTCGEWKHDHQFWSNRQYAHRRGRHSECKDCSVACRKAYRVLHPEKYALEIERARDLRQRRRAEA